jgi:hypothetical protein
MINRKGRAGFPEGLANQQHHVSKGLAASPQHSAKSLWLFGKCKMFFHGGYASAADTEA